MEVIEVGLIDSNGKAANFKLSFYGVSYEKIVRELNESAEIKEALRKRGLTDFTAAYVRKRYAPTPRHKSNYVTWIQVE